MGEELRGLHVVVVAELVAATYAKAEAEGKTLSEAVTDLLVGYTAKPMRTAIRKRSGRPETNG